MASIEKLKTVPLLTDTFEGKDTDGLIFLALWIIIFICAWYWIMFKNGAKAMSIEVENLYRGLGMHNARRAIFYTPLAVKIISCLFLFFALLGVFLVLENVFKFL